MAESALIEAFGPLDEIETAVLALPGVDNERRNRVGSLLVDMNDMDITVGRGTVATLISVDGRTGDVLPTAGEIFRGVAVMVDYPMQLINIDTDAVVQARGTIPAS